MTGLRNLAKRAAARAAALLPAPLLQWMLSRYPLHAGMELSNVCNANCSFCAYRYLKRAKRSMDAETFRKTLDFFAGLRPRSLNLTPTVGDPLLVGDLADKVAAICRRGFKEVFFYTNAIALGRHDVDALLCSGLARMAVSTILDGPEAYRRYYGVDKYDDVVENLRRLLDAGSRSGRFGAKVTFHLRSPRPDPAAMDPRGAALLRDIAPRNLDWLTEFKNWGHAIQPDDIPEHATLRAGQIPAGRQGRCCAELYRRIHVFADGKVGSCACCDLEASLIFGSVEGQGAVAVWRGAALRKIRDAFEAGHPPALCRTCDNYEPVDAFIEKNRMIILLNYLAHRFSLNI